MQLSLTPLATVADFAWLAGLLALIVASWLIWRSVSGKRTAPAFDPMLVGTRQGVLAILSQAADSKYRFEMRIQHGALAERLLSALLVDVKDADLTVELPANIRPGKALLGLPVEAFVTGKGPRGMSFYSLQSTILDVSRGPDGEGRIVLATPERMQLFSRRTSLRTEVPDGYLRAVEVWPGQPACGGEPFDQAALGGPAMHWRKGEGGTVHLRDISGNGLRLGNLPPPPGGRELADTQRHAIVRLELNDPVGDEPGEHWLACEVRNEHRRPDGRLDAGFRIECHAAPDHLGLPRWRRLDGDEDVPVLGEWVFRYHLIAHRQARAGEDRGN